MKHVLLLDNKSLEFYDFEILKQKNNVQIYCVVSNTYFEKIPEYVKEHIKNFFILNVTPTLFPEPFEKNNVTKIIQDHFSEEIKQNNFFISCADEINMPLAASLREQFIIPGTNKKTVVLYTNKYLQRKILLQKKINIPSFSQFSLEKLKKISYDELCNKFPPPFIIKPINSTASVCVGKICSQNDFETYLKKIEEYFFSYFLIESFQEGKLFHVDLVVQNEKTIFAQPCEYFFNGLAFTQGKIHGSIPLTEQSVHFKPLTDFAKSINRTFNIKNGVTHHEIFINNKNELIFLEAACRPPGSLVPKIYQEMFNINILNVNFLIDAQETVEISLSNSCYAFWSIFPQQMNQINMNHFCDLRNKVDFIKAEHKQHTNLSKSLIDKSASMIVQSHSYRSLLKDFESVKKISESFYQSNTRVLIT